MRKLVTGFSLMALATGVALLLPHGASAPVAAPARAAFLLRFGIDGKADADWSGSIASDRVRLSPWQFDKNDVLSGRTWTCSTRKQTYWDTPYERAMQPTSQVAKVTAKGLLVEIEKPAPQEIRVSTKQGDFSFRPDLVPGDAPRLLLNGSASVAAVAADMLVTNDGPADDYPSMVEAKDGTLWLAYQAYSLEEGDRILVRHFSSGVWSAAETLAGPGDYFRTALAQDRAGRIWAVWSARTDSKFDLWGRAWDGQRWSPARQFTHSANPSIYHSLASDAKGNLYLAWQSARTDNFDIYLRVWDGRSWSRELQVSDDPANDWEPALAVAPNGDVTIVWDTYSRGNYDVVARTFRNGQLGPVIPIAASGAFETRASAAYDRAGRLWVAWDQGDWNWGKDYGYEIPESGRGLLSRRQVRVGVLENGTLRQPAAPIEAAVPEEFRQVFHHPALVFDGADNPWVFFRIRNNLPEQKKAEGPFRALWKTEATTLRDGQWSPMMEFPQGYGRIDSPLAAIRKRDGSLAVAWVTDGRVWPDGRPLQQDIRFTAIAAGRAGQAPALTAFVPSTDNLPLSHSNEAADVARARAYRVSIGGRTWRIVRGDIHRHTDLSWDGNRDGSLDDSYRYALDAAGFDYLGVCDHQAGQSIPYNWWRIQKAVDMYTIAGRFAPIYSYERSLKWPNGHRNVFFATRGNPVLEIPPREASGEEGAAKLFAYLRKFGGLTSPHTSATGAGTDFRDIDPEVQPVVEIYQGYRSNYESAEAPRKTDRQELSRFSAGLVWSAWAKGAKLGVQASSDHVSTHISYADFWVDGVDRPAILEAMKARRSFAATDNIFVDVRMGAHFMGASFVSSATVPPLEVYVAGTGKIARVQVIKSNKIVYTAPGAASELRFTYTDHDMQPGESYYYVRVEQENGQLAWSSPIWVTKN
jgi:hypothetical protein